MNDPSLEPKIATSVPTPSSADTRLEQSELMALDAKIKALLPPHYENCYQDVQPVSMGSAALKFGPDGQVAWDQIWTTFCDLALAGGPPHRGKWLESVSADEARADKALYDAVVKEMARGIWLVTELPVLPHAAPGWVGIRCSSEAMAAWLVRAIVAENVSARHHGELLHVPAGPHFRLEKETKNVITAVAKTCHYWTCHMPAAGQQPSPVELALPTNVRGAPGECNVAVREIELGIQRATGLTCLTNLYPGWVGIECADAEMAVWLMRALAVENLLVRREDSLLFLCDKAQAIVSAFSNAHRLWMVYLSRKN